MKLADAIDVAGIDVPRRVRAIFVHPCDPKLPLRRQRWSTLRVAAAPLVVIFGTLVVVAVSLRLLVMPAIVRAIGAGYSPAFTMVVVLGFAAVTMFAIVLPGLRSLLPFLLPRIAPDCWARPYRRERLERIAARADVAVRLPHRMIERDELAALVGKRNLYESYARVRGGDIVIINPPADFRWPAPGSLRFEAVHTQSDGMQLCELGIASAESDFGADPDAFYRWAQSPNGQTPGHYQPATQRRASELAWILLGGILLLVSFSLTADRPSPGLLTFVAITYAMLALLMVVSAWREGRVGGWLIPGGLFCRVKPTRSFQQYTRQVRSRDAGLVLAFWTRLEKTPWAAATAYVCVDGQVWRQRLNGAAIRGFLAGWLSTAPPPTDEQIEAYLGVRG